MVLENPLCRTRHAAPNIEYLEHDILSLDYEKLKKEFGYTIAIFSHILEHINDVPTLLNKVKADKILITVPSQENWFAQFLHYMGMPYGDPSHKREYTREMLKTELTSASYRIDFMGFNSEGEIICKAGNKELA